MSIPNESVDHEITLEDTPTPEEIADQAALELVKTDAQAAQSWIEGQQWNEQWRMIDILYDSPRQFSTWEGSTTQKAAVNRFILCQHVNAIYPQMVEGLFYDDQYFLGTPRPGTDNDVVRARTAVIREQLEDMNFRQEVDLGMFQMVLHGTGIWKWGLRQVEESYSEFKAMAQPLTSTGPLGVPIEVTTKESTTYTEERKTRQVYRPFLENREIRNVLVDPRLKLPNIQSAKFVIDKYYVTLGEVLEMAKDPAYILPSDETIKEWFTAPKEQPAVLGNLGTDAGSPTLAGQGAPDWEETSEDPYQQSLLVLERWDKDKVITTLNEKAVIQNRANPYGTLPFYSANYQNRIRSFWGIGLGKIVGTDQRIQQGIENAGLGLLQLLTDPPFVISEDSYVPTQNVRFRKGGFIKVKGSVKDAITPLQMPNLPIGEIFAFMQNSEAKAEAASGANELFTQGAMPGPGTGGKTSATRNATGVNAITGANAARIQAPVERFVNQVFIPWIYQLDELNKRFIMTTPEGMEQIKTILGDTLGPDFTFQPGEFLNGRVEFDCLAGAQLQSKAKMAQALPLITQIFDNPAIQSQLNTINEEYVDVGELLKMWMETTGWRNTRNLIKPMTAEMKQRQQANNASAQKTQAAMAMENQKFQHSSELLHQKGEQGIARDAVKQGLTTGSEPQEEEKSPLGTSLTQGTTHDLRSDFENFGQ